MSNQEFYFIFEVVFNGLGARLGELDENTVLENAIVVWLGYESVLAYWQHFRL